MAWVLMSDLWVFGYGSLMWRPGFSYKDARPAILHGYHRSFCIYSHHWRGTPEQPGLVLGLTPGGSCPGTVFRVAEAKRDAVVDYLNERELSSYAYVAQTLSVDMEGEAVDAYVFIADEGHCHYAGELPPVDAARIIMDAEGVAGLNRDYLINTVRELERYGYIEGGLHDLLRVVEELTGEIEQGSGI